MTRVQCATCINLFNAIHQVDRMSKSTSESNERFRLYQNAVQKYGCPDYFPDHHYGVKL